MSTLEVNESTFLCRNCGHNPIKAEVNYKVDAAGIVSCELCDTCQSQPE